MTVDYDARVRAVEDATRLVLAMTGETTEPLDRFDVVELARFLLDIEDGPGLNGPYRSSHQPCEPNCNGVPHIIGWRTVNSQVRYECARCRETFTLSKDRSAVPDA